LKGRTTGRIKAKKATNVAGTIKKKILPDNWFEVEKNTMD
tara:strand:- start:515 stop:634 length:120 start_codon:yes stop_codon:yes gene_type:complete